MILIVGDPRDPHVAGVAREIEALGGRAAIFAKHNADCRLSMATAGGSTALTVLIGDETFAAETISAVWWRQKPFQYFGEDDKDLAEIETFADKEWFQPLLALEYFLRAHRPRWINDPWRQMVANIKPVQLDWAAQAGFRVPDTLFSSDKADILRFVEAQPAAIYKTFSSALTEGNKFIFTTPVSASDIAPRRAEDFAIAPGIFQAYADKAFELRVIFVDDAVFTIRIDSQRHEETIIDWRHDQTMDIYEAMTLSDDHLASIRAFIAASGLSYGAIDGIIAPDGQF